MYLIERVSRKPETAIRILIDEPEEGNPDAGFTRGGSFAFSPGDPPVPVSDAAAAAIMDDPVFGEHFETVPKWTRKASAKVAAAAEKAEKAEHAEKAAETPSTRGKASK
jgi:hypothetical protein